MSSAENIQHEHGMFFAILNHIKSYYVMVIHLLQFQRVKETLDNRGYKRDKGDTK